MKDLQKTFWKRCRKINRREKKRKLKNNNRIGIPKSIETPRLFKKEEEPKRKKQSYRREIKTNVNLENKSYSGENLVLYLPPRPGYSDTPS